ncbi:MAG TPA: transcriptional repressor LexA [Dehalococcoidia bacterium]|nr:transcriptional repressor LexA [Dehalococcoidia bacterium]
MAELSDKQQRILTFIEEFIEEHDYPPSIRDIQTSCQISSTSVVDYNLKALERGGHIKRGREVSRAIEVVGSRRRRTTTVPILGSIAAGQPIPVPDETADYDDTIDLTDELLQGKRDVFALRVKGDSMIDALVNDGDIVVLEQTDSARDGDMVAAWIKSEETTTLKKFYREGQKVRLQPANSTMSPIYVDARDVEVQGKLVCRLGTE